MPLSLGRHCYQLLTAVLPPRYAAAYFDEPRRRAAPD